RREGVHLLRQAGRGGRGGGGRLCPHPPAVSGPGGSRGPHGGRRSGAAGRPAAAGEPVVPAVGPAGSDPGGAGGMRMWDVLWMISLDFGYFLTVAASGFFLSRLCTPFVRLRRARFWKALLFLPLAGTSGMV